MDYGKCENSVSEDRKQGKKKSEKRKKGGQSKSGVNETFESFAYNRRELGESKSKERKEKKKKKEKGGWTKQVSRKQRG